MESLFPLIQQKNKTYSECAIHVLISLLKTKDSYNSFKEEIIKAFIAQVSIKFNIGFLYNF